MKSKLLRSLLFCTVAFCGNAALAQEQDFSKVTILTEKVSGSLYMLTGRGGNIGLSVGADAVFMIDDQYAPLTPKIKAAIAKLTKKPVKFLVNTHWHFDHTGGNENFGKAGAIIVAHENVRKRMSTDQFIEFFNMKNQPSPMSALPVITFSTDIAFHINGDEVSVSHVPPAHTDGDSIVHFKNANAVHAGDAFFNKLYPFIDTGSGGSIDGMIVAVDRVLNLANDNTKIIPGHGPLASKADLKLYRNMLATVSERIKSQIKDGKKLEEVVAAKPTAEFDAVWGQGFLTPAQFVELIYKNLQK